MNDEIPGIEAKCYSQYKLLVGECRIQRNVHNDTSLCDNSPRLQTLVYNVSSQVLSVLAMTQSY